MSLALPLIILSPVLAANPPDPPQRSTGGVIEVIGLTNPARSAELGPVRAGRILAFHVREGESVEEGDLLFTLNNAVQAARVEVARAKAESELEVQFAAAEWEKSKAELKRIESLNTRANAAPKELTDARVEAELNRIKYEIARFELEQARRTLKEEEASLEELNVRAPFNGYVADRMKELGESVDQLEPVFGLAQLDPLHVTVNCPLNLAPSVRPGRRCSVIPVDPEWPSREGEVILVDRVADAATQTFEVRLAINNRDNAWMAGLKVRVVFDSGQEASAEPVGLDAPDSESVSHDQKKIAKQSPN